MKKSILLVTMFSLVLFLGLTGNVSAGYGPTGEQNMILSGQFGQNDGWTLATSSGNVDFYYKMAECNGEKVVFLKIDNKNSFNVKVSWKEAVMDKTFNKVTDAFYGKKEIVLASGSASAGNCNSAAGSEFLVNLTTFTATHPVDAQNFEFKEISVSPATN